MEKIVSMMENEANEYLTLEYADCTEDQIIASYIDPYNTSVENIVEFIKWAESIFDIELKKINTFDGFIYFEK